MFTLEFMTQRRGFILIIVVSLLGVMALMAVTLAHQARNTTTLSTLERDRVRARLLARSGLEESILRLRADPWDPERLFFGSDGDRDGEVSAAELARAGLTTASNHLQDALSPSFPQGDEITLGEVQRGVSGLCFGGAYRLRVTGLQSTIDLNGGVLGGELSGADFDGDHGWLYSAADVSHPFNTPTVRWLNALGDVIKYGLEGANDNTYNYSQPFSAGFMGQVFHPCLVTDNDGDPDAGVPGTWTPDALHPANQLGVRLVQGRPAAGWSREQWPEILEIIDVFGEEVLGTRDLGRRIRPWLSLDPPRDDRAVMRVRPGLNLVDPLPPADVDTTTPPPPPDHLYADNNERHADLMAMGSSAAAALIDGLASSPNISYSNIQIHWFNALGVEIPPPTPSDLPSDAVPNGVTLGQFTYVISVSYTMDYDMQPDGIVDFSIPFPADAMTGSMIPPWDMLIDNGPPAEDPDDVFDPNDSGDPDTMDRYFTVGLHWRDDRSGEDWHRRDWRVYRVPRSRLNLNGASIEVLASMIHGHGEILTQSDHVRTGGVTRYSRPNIHLRENGRPLDEVLGPRYQAVVGGGSFGYDPDFPLFSVTESIKLARDLQTRAVSTPFTDLSHELLAWLSAWDKGWDSRRRTQALGLMDESEGWRISGGTDPLTWWTHPQNRQRQRILWCLLSEARGASELLNEAALPDLFAPDQEWHFQATAHQSAAGVNGANKGIAGQHEFDLFAHHSPVTSLTLEDGRFEILSEGLALSPDGGRIIARSTLRTTLDLFETLRIDSQREFETILPAASDWTTYPELPGNTMAVTCDWDGWVALKPDPQTPAIGSSLRLLVPFNAYTRPLDPTSAVQGSDWPVDPGIVNGLYRQDGDWVAAASGWTRGVNVLPSPGEPSPPLLGPRATDLMPGGGMQVPEGDSFIDDNLDWHVQHRQLALAINPGDFPAQSIENGALSFWMKPTHHWNFFGSQTRTCLASVNFIVHDPAAQAVHGADNSYFNGRITLFMGFITGRFAFDEYQVFPKTHLPDPLSYGGGSVGMQGALEPASLHGGHSKLRFKYWATYSLALRRNMNTPRAPAGVPLFQLDTGLANLATVDPSVDYVFKRHAVLGAPFETGFDAVNQAAAANNRYVVTDPNEEGRWMHVALAWRDMSDLDDTNRGILGLWLNGTLKKDMDWSGTSYTLDGEFFAENYQSDASPPYSVHPRAASGLDDDLNGGTSLFQGTPTHVGAEGDDDSSGVDAPVPQAEHLYTDLANRWHVGHMPYQGPGDISKAPFGKAEYKNDYVYMDCRMYSDAMPLYSGSWFRNDFPSGTLSPLPLTATETLDVGALLPAGPGTLRQVRWVPWIPRANFMEFTQTDPCGLVLRSTWLPQDLVADRNPATDVRSWNGVVTLPSMSALSMELDYTPQPARQMTTASPLVREITLVYGRAFPKVIDFSWE